MSDNTKLHAISKSPLCGDIVGQLRQLADMIEANDCYEFNRVDGVAAVICGEIGQGSGVTVAAYGPGWDAFRTIGLLHHGIAYLTEGTTDV